ncbi:hypothetical protein GCM10019016_052010 [Streptomyces prasinosporus]|uniref:Uncharacterized protein n=1 Tax=Streptomyces prasinosporus TaxID=68256 RepID=A0ABP6TTN4_9ACTN
MTAPGPPRGRPAVHADGGPPAAFTLRGVPWHARLLGFTVDGTTYQINTWCRPEIEASALETYERVRDGFTVL